MTKTSEPAALEMTGVIYWADGESYTLCTVEYAAAAANNNAAWTALDEATDALDGSEAARIAYATANDTANQTLDALSSLLLAGHLGASVRVHNTNL